MTAWLAIEQALAEQGLIGCRLHGPRCRAPWGWDAEHSDSDRPYTLDELAGRRKPPHRYAYPSLEAYLAGWELWRALKRDEALSTDEWEAVFQVRMGRIVDRVPTWLGDELRRQFLGGGS